MKYKSFLSLIIFIFTICTGRFVFAQYITVDQNLSSLESSPGVLNVNMRSGNALIFGDNDLYVITSSGNVGVYNPAPAYKFDVTGNAYFTQPVTVGTPTGSNHAATKSYVDSMVGGGIATGNSGETLRHTGASWANSSLLYNNATNIGVGTTNPLAPFHTYSATPAGGLVSIFQSGGATGYIQIQSTGSSWQIGATGNGLELYNNNTSASRATLTNAGSLGLGTQAPAYTLDVRGTASFTSPVIVGTPTQASHAATKNYIDSALASFWVTTSTNMYAGNSGNVGIGTTNPGAKLEVSGLIHALGFQLGTSATAGYVLTTDASGNASWQAYTQTQSATGPSENVMSLRSANSAPKAIPWQIYTSYNPATYITCPTGYTLWWNSNATYYSSESGYQAYTGACYPSSATNDLFRWRSTSPSSVTCPSGYTSWYPSWYDMDPQGSGSYDGVCYKGATLPTFSWSAYTYGTQTCPTGLTNWYDSSYARWRPYWYNNCSICDGSDDNITYSNWSYSQACYNPNATDDVFTWRTYSGATSVTCPTGYTRWVGQYEYGSYGQEQVYSGACIKGNPPSFTWESYTGLGNPSVVTCPSGYTNWSNTAAVYYNAPYSGYQAYTGACVNNTSYTSDAFTYLANASSNSISCPTGYTKYTNTQPTYKRYSSQQTYDSACYRTQVSPCPTCPSGWSSTACNATSKNGVDVNERICYRTDSPFQTLTLRKKGVQQSLSCPSGWSQATASSTDLGGNTELTCYVAVCPNGMTIPLAPSSLVVTPGGFSTNLSWTAPTGGGCAIAQTYKIYRSTTSGSGYSMVASGVTSTTYIDSGLTAGTTYYYKVSGVNTGGEGSLSNEGSAIPTSSLFTFSAHTFTACGQVGYTGPTLAQCQTAYSTTTWASNSSFFTVTGGIQYWTVPATGNYRIEAYGAEGGSGDKQYSSVTSNRGGKGARMRGDFALTQGQQLKIIVGQRGSHGDGGCSQTDTGGGGGTFIAKSDNTPLLVAGGGGGGPYSAGNYTGYQDGQTTTYGGSANNCGTYNSTAGGAGNYCSSSGGAGGAGFTGGSGSAYISNGGTEGYSFTNGGNGGLGTQYYSTRPNGGFGGGGGGGHGCCWGSGGGGGYTGGTGANGCYAGGGGGSYNAGTNQSNSSGVKTGDGSVTIQVL